MTPPEVITSTRMFTGKVFDVDRDRLHFDDGRDVEVDIVRHRASVVMIPLAESGEIILVRQYRHAIARWIWELPAGTTEPGEDPAEAAARECHEEVGMVPGRVTRLGSMFPTPGFCDEEMIFYLLEDLRAPGEVGRSSAVQDPDEQLEPRAFTVDALDALAGRGELCDMKTVAGLELLRRARAS